VGPIGADLERVPLSQYEAVTRRVTLAVEAVETGAAQRSSVRGEVWLGPVVVGDLFTAASDGTGETDVRLRVAEIAEPAEVQDVGRAARVVVVLRGKGADSLRPGIVLLGEVGDTYVICSGCACGQLSSAEESSTDCGRERGAVSEDPGPGRHDGVMESR
jgi:hypothetical protein